MNNKIKKLAIEAGFTSDEIRNYFSNRNNPVLEFAKLITKECLFAVDDTNTKYVHTSFDQELVEKTLEECKIAIINHMEIKQ